MPQFAVGNIPSPGIGPSPGTGGTIPIPVGRTMMATHLWAVNFTFARRVLRATCMRQDIWALESPYYAVAGESLPLTCIFEFSFTVTSPVVKVYKDGTDVTGVNMPTGSPAVSVNVVTLPALTALQAGERYIVALTAVVDGATMIRKMEFIVSNPGDEQ